MLAGKIGYFRASLDPAAAAYIAAVEAADGQALESAVRAAINKFVVGCKADGIWSAIKASCILCGARTLAGALVPLVGTAPTNFNFVAADYNRTTGLVGNGTTKYLDSGRLNAADPQDNHHQSVYRTADTTPNRFYVGAAGNATGASHLGTSAATNNYLVRLRAQTGASGSLTNGFFGASRSASASYTVRAASATTTVTQASQTPASGNIFVFCRQVSGALNSATDGRLAFYSIGEGLTLASLDSRVTALYNAIGAAIP